MTGPTRPLRARATLSAGDRIGAYVLSGRELGRGGFGAVFEAIQPVAELRVAIKIQDCRGDGAAIERATREARALARIHHRNVVRILDAGELESGEQYIAMELLAGETLRDMLAREQRLPLAKTLALLGGVASALDAIHARGILHRDIKPSNVFLCRDDDGEVYPKLIDFGIAKDLVRTDGADVTRSGAFVGTPSYMSPEQCKGARELDTRSDIYSLGLIAYHMLCGRPPFVGDPVDIAYHIVHTAPPAVQTLAPELPAALDGAFAAILAKRPEDRPASATEAVERLASAQAAEIEAVVAPRRWRLAAVGFVAIALTAGIAYRVTSGRTDDDAHAPDLAGTASPSPDARLADSASDAIDAGVVAPASIDARPGVRPRPERGINDPEPLGP